jgi:DNA processing protein
LSCGIDVVYPAENRKLYQDICPAGTIVSEFKFGTKLNASNFPQRNRVISGLAHATVVVEAGHKSGAMLTAFNAINQKGMCLRFRAGQQMRKAKAQTDLYAMVLFL